MSILAECPFCHRRQSVRNKICGCGGDLVKSKRSQKVRYWVCYRLPNGKQRIEQVGYSIEEARDADGKRRTQKRENRIFDIIPDAKMTFDELSKWYLDLEQVKSKAYYSTFKITLNSFLAEFGNIIVNQLMPVDLENYQARRKGAGYSDSYIDHEVGAARTMVNKAFDNNLVSGETVRVFKKVKKLLKRNANARDKILTLDQFSQLMDKLPVHSKAILATAFYTGMRKGEILALTWDKADLKNRVIRLESGDTKDREPRRIPICDKLYEILKDIPRAVHDNHVFLYKGKPIRDLRSALYRACRDAGIPTGRATKGGFVFHDLRHTFNTFMRKSGVQESVIMDITGHSTREMFDRYNTVDEEDRRQAVDRMQTFLANVD